MRQPADLPERTSLVRQAREVLAAAKGGTILVTGLSGMGKTTFLRTIEPTDKRWKIVNVTADPYEADQPFAAVERILRFVSSKRTAFVPVDAVAHPRQIGGRLLDEFDRSRLPVLLTVDDAQWLDPASARALRFAANRMLDGRFVAVVATRPSARQNAFVQLLTELAATGERHLALAIEPLAAQSVQTFAGRALGRGISMRSAQQLREATGGSPALLTAALDVIGATAHETTSLWEMPIPLVAAARNPFARLLESASRPAQNLAEIAAILRSPVPVAAIRQVAAALRREVDLDAAREAGLIEVYSWQGDLWLRPRHDLLTHSIEQSLDPALTRHIHRAAGTVLPGRAGLRHSLCAATEADGPLLAAVRMLAQSSQSVAEADEAIRTLRIVLDLLPPGPEYDDALLDLVLLALRFRRHQNVLDLLPQIEALPNGPVAAAVRVETLAVSGRLDRALVEAKDYDGSAPENDSAEGRIVRAYIAGQIPQFQLTTGDMAPILEQVAVGRRRVNDVRTTDAEAVDPRLRWMFNADSQHMRLLGWAITGASRTGSSAELSAAFAELSGLIEKAAASPELVDALVTRSGIRMQTGDVPGTLSDMLAARSVLARYPHAWTAGHVPVIRAHAQYLLGDWEGSLATADTALSHVWDETAFSIRPVTYAVASLVRASRGEKAAVLALVEAGERSRVSPHETYESAMAVIAQAELARALGDPEDVLRICSAPSLRALESTTRGWLTYRVEALAGLGRVGEARQALAEISALAAGKWQPFHGSITWLNARVEDAAGHHKTAHELYQRALCEPAAVSYPFPLARVRFDYGRLLLAVGRDAEALEQLQLAAATFTQLGAAPDLERAVRLIRLAGGTDDAVPIDPFDTLTERERQIAHHASRGHTNREIAETLFLSVTTINFHMRNVMSKLGLVSRRQLRSMVGGA
nr:LuxR C-terminal-related transcriptional regulator [Leifsonia psychrotolerans]